MSLFAVLDMLGASWKGSAQQLHGGLRGARGEGVERTREAHVFRPIKSVVLALAHHRDKLAPSEEPVPCRTHKLESCERLKFFQCICTHSNNFQ